jgi:hypothetical protein
MKHRSRVRKGRILARTSNLGAFINDPFIIINPVCIKFVVLNLQIIALIQYQYCDL